MPDTTTISGVIKIVETAASSNIIRIIDPSPTAKVIQILAPGPQGANSLTEGAAWSSSASFLAGQVVTYKTARWFAAAPSTNSIPSRTNPNWVHLGLWAVVSTTDPGGGMMWFSTA